MRTNSTLVVLLLAAVPGSSAPLNRLGGWPTTDEPLDCAMRGLGLEYAKGEIFGYGVRRL